MTAAARRAGLHTDIQTTPVRAQVIDLAKGRSAVIDLPADAGDVFVSNPNVADAVLRTPRRIFVMGVNAGVSDILFFDSNGRQILNLSVRVDAATDELSDTVHRLFPNTHVDVQSLNGQVILSGMVASDGQADQILRVAQTFADKPEHVINLMSIAGRDQVSIKVRIVEVNRSTIKQLGFSNSPAIGKTGGVQYTAGARPPISASTNAPGRHQRAATSTTWTQQPELQVSVPPASAAPATGIIKGPQDAANWATAIAGTTVGNAGLNQALSNLEAFERVGLARTLAEPNLTAVSGESAKFLAGGEFPVPVSQDSDGRITVEFKPFGVGLGFTPIVQSSGRISLKISTEVSELTNTGAFTSSTTLTIPALDVRRAETTVEMQSGSSMMIAGLLQSKYKQTVDCPARPDHPADPGRLVPLARLRERRDRNGGHRHAVHRLADRSRPVPDPGRQPADRRRRRRPSSWAAQQGDQAKNGATGRRPPPRPANPIRPPSAMSSNRSRSMILCPAPFACRSASSPPRSPCSGCSVRCRVGRASGAAPRPGSAGIAICDDRRHAGEHHEFPRRTRPVGQPAPRAGPGRVARRLDRRSCPSTCRSSPRAIRRPSPPAAAMADYLYAHDVADKDLSLKSAPDQASDIVTVNLVFYRAHHIDCNQSWENLAATGGNQTYENFGCAVTANHRRPGRRSARYRPFARR